MPIRLTAAMLTRRGSVAVLVGGRDWRADSTARGRRGTIDPDWQPLFDGKTLTNWKPTKSSAREPVKAENGQIILEWVAL